MCDINKNIEQSTEQTPEQTIVSDTEQIHEQSTEQIIIPDTEQTVDSDTEQTPEQSTESDTEQNNQPKKIWIKSRHVKPGRKKLEMPKRNKELVPYGTGSCFFCRLPYDELKAAHNKVFNEGWSKSRLQQWVKAQYNYGLSPNTVVDHFKYHISQTTQAMSKVDKDKIQLVNMDINKLTGSNKHLEEAFLKITEMTKLLTGTAYDAAKIFDSIDRDKLVKEINETSPLKAMETITKFVRMAHDLYKSASSLRAPKVLIAQFLEKALEEVFFETGSILQQACVSVQLEVTKILEKNSIKSSGDMFSNLFKTISEDYELSMRKLARDLMVKMMNNLEDLENIV